MASLLHALSSVAVTCQLVLQVRLSDLVAIMLSSFDYMVQFTANPGLVSALYQLASGSTKANMAVQDAGSSAEVWSSMICQQLTSSLKAMAGLELLLEGSLRSLPTLHSVERVPRRN